MVNCRRVLGPQGQDRLHENTGEIIRPTPKNIVLDNSDSKDRSRDRASDKRE